MKTVQTDPLTDVQSTVFMLEGRFLAAPKHEGSPPVLVVSCSKSDSNRAPSFIVGVFPEVDENKKAAVKYRLDDGKVNTEQWIVVKDWVVIEKRTLNDLLYGKVNPSPRHRQHD